MEGWEPSENAHPMPIRKGMKGGERVGIVRESPPNAHRKRVKGGQRVGIVREDPPNAHAKRGQKPDALHA